MPYIERSRRDEIAEDVKVGKEPKLLTAGELNYVLTKTCLGYLHAKGTSYATMNDIVGALECAKMELYRRLVIPYEDTKIVQNGDVY